MSLLSKNLLKCKWSYALHTLQMSPPLLSSFKAPLLGQGPFLGIPAFAGKLIVPLPTPPLPCLVRQPELSGSSAVTTEPTSRHVLLPAGRPSVSSVPTLGCPVSPSICSSSYNCLLTFPSG